MRVIKRSLAIFLIAIISILGLTGCIFDKKDDTKTNSTKENETKVKEVDYSPYYDLINRITSGLKKGPMQEEFLSMGVSSRFYQNVDYEELGYVIRDLDGDGIDELILGCNAVSHSEWGNFIYDIFTIKDGQMVHILDGWERNIYQLCDDGTIYNSGSGGAGYRGYSFYDYKKGVLTRKEAISQEREKWHYTNEPKEEPYVQYGTEAIYEEPYKGMTLISKDQADSIINGYESKIVKIDFIPFVNKNEKM